MESTIKRERFIFGLWNLYPGNENSSASSGNGGIGNEDISYTLGHGLKVDDDWYRSDRS